jgi:hypothetical protein
MRLTIGVIIVVAACISVQVSAKSALHRHHGNALHNNGTAKMTETMLKQCTVQSANVTLVPDGVFTRTAITEETIEKFGYTKAVPANDPSALALSAIMNEMVLDASTVNRFDIRLRLQIECADGSHHSLLAARPSANGLLNLIVNGKPASTVYPLRAKLDTLFPA